MNPIALTAQLVRTPSLSGHEDRVAQVVEEVMRQLGYREVFVDRMGSVIGIVGPASGPPRVLFDGHMDVMPAVGRWSVDPHGGEVMEGRLYGRGSTDMKGGLAAAICGAARAAQRGLIAPVAVSATVLEETIEGLSLLEVLDALNPRRVIICEPSELAIQTGQRGRMEILMRVEGVPAHAAYPERGINPIELAARAIGALERWEPPSDPLLGEGILVPTDIVSDPYPSISVIPEGVEVRFDRRTLVGEQPEGVLGGIAAHLASVSEERFSFEVTTGEVVTYTGVVMDAPRFLPAWSLHRDHSLVSAAEAAVGRAGEQVRLGVYGVCTNGSASAGARGIPTIGLGPGSAADAHVVDESVSVAQVRQASHIYEELTIELAGA